MAETLAYAYLPQDANVLSKGYPFMGEVVEGTTKIPQKTYLKILLKARDYRVITALLPRDYRNIPMTKRGENPKNRPQKNLSSKSDANILFFPDISKFPASKNNEKYIKVEKYLRMSFFLCNFAAQNH